jgi:hypothetical protein
MGRLKAFTQLNLLGYAGAMAFTRPPTGKVVPTAPTGDAIASYPTYAEAQKAVAYLVEQRFEVESLIIVGTNLKSVERVTGRLSYGRVALAGAMSGAWFGLFIGLLMSLFGGQAPGFGFISVGIGAGFGLLFSVLSYSFSRGKRDFTSSTQIVAEQYTVLCAPAVAIEARRLLSASPVGLGAVPGGSGSRFVPVPIVGSGTTTQPTRGQVISHQTNAEVTENLEGNNAENVPTIRIIEGLEGEDAAATVAPKKIDPRWQTPDGRPRFGALAAEVDGAVGSGSIGQGSKLGNTEESLAGGQLPSPAVEVDSGPSSAAGANSLNAVAPDDFDPYSPPR